MDTKVSIIYSKEWIKMNMKKSMTLIMMGIGGTLLYQQIRNGNARRYLKDMENMLKDEMEDLEDMM